MPQTCRSFAEVVEKASGMGCRAYKAPALSRRRKVAYHAGKKEPLVGLAAAAARCMVGGAGGGLPLAAGHEDNGSAGCAEQRTGRAVCVGVEQRQPALFACVYGDLCGSGYRGRDGQKNTRPGAEHGSAAWGDVFRLNKFYMDKRGPNLLLTQHFHIGIDGYKHKHNTNILIVGGSGAGKTRTYGVPNVLECACSMVITDPKGEILRKTGNLLKLKGYEVIVFDLINPAASFCYNPFVYVQDDHEVLTLISKSNPKYHSIASQSTTLSGRKSETALLQALMLYLLHEAPARRTKLLDGDGNDRCRRSPRGR